MSNEWQPIDTAPKYASHIIVYCPVFKIVSEAHWNHEYQAWFYDNPVTLEGLLHPTHWMPLPPPPSQETSHVE